MPAKAPAATHTIVDEESVMLPAMKIAPMITRKPFTPAAVRTL
jgi:hypothetical protein